jgi:hypothetical protein
VETHRALLKRSEGHRAAIREPMKFGHIPGGWPPPSAAGEPTSLHGRITRNRMFAMILQIFIQQ